MKRKSYLYSQGIGPRQVKNGSSKLIINFIHQPTIENIRMKGSQGVLTFHQTSVPILNINSHTIVPRVNNFFLIFYSNFLACKEYYYYKKNNFHKFCHFPLWLNNSQIICLTRRYTRSEFNYLVIFIILITLFNTK